MATPRYRIGNDLSVFWAIHNRDGSPFDMEGMEVHLYMTNERGRKEVDAILSKLDGETTNNVIRWDYAGEDQRVLGLHSLTIEILESNSHREIVKDYCEAFELVSRSNEETEEGDANVSVRGDLILSSKLDIYRFEAVSVDVGDLKEDIKGITDSLQDINESIKGIGEESIEIKTTINGIQKEVNEIGTELTTKASVNSVIEIGEQITEVQENVAEQTIKVDGLSAEISTKASSESVTEIAGELEITNKTLAEQSLKVTDLETEISTKASVDSVTEIDEGLKTTAGSLAEQVIKVTALESEISTKASTESVTQIADGLNITNQTVAEQKIRTDEIEASIENLVTKETFNAATGEIANEFTSIKQTTDSIETTIQSQSGEIASIKGGVSGLSVEIGKVQTDLDSLRDQLDGVTESYFYDYSPSNTNEPAKTWIESGTEASHKGDTFTNTALEGEGAGKSWRWLQASDGSWSWHPIADTDAQKALLLASQAQAAADGKVTIFYQLPDKYKVGDIWFVHSDDYHPYKKGEILSSSETSTIFNLGHWESKTRYSKAVDDLNETMNTTFRDGVLDDAERKAIKDNLNNLYKDKQSVDGRYNTIVANADFNDTTLKNEFKAVKASYDSAYNSLATIVEQIIAASTEGLKTLFASYENLMKTYREAYAAYNTKETEVTEALMGRLNYASRYLDNITNDGVLTPIEKEQLYEIYRGIAKEYTATRNNAFNYKIWAYKVDGVTEQAGNNGGNGRYDLYVNLKNAYSPIVSAFNSSAWGFDKMDETTNLPSGYSTTQLKGYLDTYYSALGALSEAFSAITASIEEAQKNAEKTLVELTENLSPEEMLSLVGKGVVLSTIIATKDKDGNITAAMNASSALKDKSEDDHGRIIIAGGVKDLADWNNANFVLYEDGHADLRSVTVSGYASIANLELGLSGKVDIREYEQLLQVVNNLSSLFSPVYNNNGELVLIKANASFMARGYAAGATATADGGGGGIINKESIISALQYTPVNPADLGALAYRDGLSYSEVGVTKDVVTSLIGPATYAPYNANGYLPLTGGTISGPLTISVGSDVKLILNSTDGEYYNKISVREDGEEYGELLFANYITSIRGLGNLVYNSNIVLTTNNIGSYRAGDSLKLDGMSPTSYLRHGDQLTSNVDANELHGMTFHINTTGNGSGNENMPINYGYLLNLCNSSASDAIYYKGVQVSFGSGDVLQFRRHWGYAWQPWKTIAFTDSDITGSARSLKAADGNTFALIDSSGHVVIGNEKAQAGYNTHIDGNFVTLRYGTSNTIGLLLNNNGNITIGGGNLAGTTHRLYVSGTAYVANVAHLTNVEMRAINASNYVASLYMDSNGFHIQGRNEGVAYINTILNQSGGKVLIGKTTDNGSGARLQLNGDASARLYRFSRSGSLYGYIGLASANDNDITINTDSTSNLWLNGSVNTIINYYGGNVLIGTATDNGSGAKLQVNGGISIASGYTLKIGDATISYVNGVLKVDKPFMAKGYAAGATASVSSGEGGVVLNKESVIEALGYTPYDSANPNGYITTSALSGYQLSSGLGSLAYKSSLVASDIPDLSGTYLPLSGGTINGHLNVNGRIILIGGQALQFKNDSAYSTQRLLLPYSGDNYNLNYYDGTDWRRIIHSGNGIFNKQIEKDETPTVNTFGLWNNVGAYFSVGSSDAYKMEFRGAAGLAYMRVCHGSNWDTGWKTIAFTDSNVASATKLATARTIWGQSFDGTGNVGGNITLPLNSSLVNPSGQSAFMVDANGYVQVGHGTVDKTTYINGSSVALRYGSSRTTGLHLSSSGNVGIGVTTPYQKLEVGGNIMIPNYSALMSKSTGNASVNLIYLGNDDIIKIGNDSVPIKLQGEVIISKGLTTNNSITVYKNDADYTVGWARHTNVRNSEDTILSAFGFYGTGDKLEYTYIGPSYASPLVSIRPSGNVGIGVAYPTYKLDVSGTANFSGAVTMSSTLKVSGVLTTTSDVRVGGDVMAGGFLQAYSGVTIADTSLLSDGGVLSINADITPATDKAYYLGHPTKLWKGIYSDKVQTTEIKIGDATISYENGVLKIDKPLMAKGYAAGATATAN